MDEPPSKRARRDDSAMMSGERSSRKARNSEFTNPRSSMPADKGTKSRATHDDQRNGSYSSRRADGESRHRSRSPDKEDGEGNRHKQRRRSRSPRGTDRNYRDRDSGRNQEKVTRGERGERSRSRDRHHDRDHDTTRTTRDHRRNDRKRSRSSSPLRNGATSASSRHVKKESSDRKSESKKSMPNGPSSTIKHEPKSGEMEVDDDDVNVMMRKMMGFSTFKSTQNTKVPGNQIYGVRKEKKTEYRQYMNRVGGFNRPLSPGL